MPTPPLLSQLRRQFSFRTARAEVAAKSQSGRSLSAEQTAARKAGPSDAYAADAFLEELSLFEPDHSSAEGPSLSLEAPSFNRERVSPLLPSPPPRRLIITEDTFASEADATSLPPEICDPFLAAWTNSAEVTVAERATRALVSRQILQAALGDESYHSIASLSSKTLRELTSLPDRLIVREGFCVDEDASLLYLPNFLRVLGSLEIANVSCLRELPYALFVEGDLTLGRGTQTPSPASVRFEPGHSNASSFYLPSHQPAERGESALDDTEILLGAHLTVLQDLTIGKSLAPAALPTSLAVGGSLRVQNARLLRCVGPPPSVGQDVSLFGLEQSESLFDPWPIAGRLTITDAQCLRELPPGLAVGGHCEIGGAVSLEHIAPSVEFFEDLRLSELALLEVLPPSLVIGRDLVLEGAVALDALPDKLFVGRHLRVTAAVALRRFGRSIQVGQDLLLGHASMLVTLPTFSVGGKASFLECSALERLSPAQVFPRGLHLTGAIRLAKIPSTLKVHQELVIERASALERLASGLHLRTLSISDAPRMMTLPSNTEVTGDFILRSMPLLTKLPFPLRLQGTLTLVDLPALENVDGDVLDVAGRALILQCPHFVSCGGTRVASLETTDASMSKEKDNQTLLFDEQASDDGRCVPPPDILR